MQTEPADHPPTRSVVVMGVSASGKSSVGLALSQRLGFDFVDGDDLHPASNRAKMTGGTPLTDEDRWPWLDRIGAMLADRAAHPAGVVTACSSLRRIYRDRIRTAAGQGLVFVFLDLTKEEAARRIASRRGHFMPSSLLDSQFQTLERPHGEDDVVSISSLQGVAEVADEATQAIRERDGIADGRSSA